MLNNHVSAAITVRGTRPLLFHQFNVDALQKRQRGGTPGDNPDEWRSTFRCTHDGYLYLDPSYVFGAIRDGGRYIRLGRKSLRDRVAATLQVDSGRIVIANRRMPQTLSTNPEESVFLDIRSVRIGLARHIRYRVAAAAGWESTFQVTWDRTFIDLNVMNSIVIEAGRFNGLGDGRAIGYGRFVVTQFEVVDYAETSSSAIGLA